MGYVEIACQLLLAGVFAWSATSKLMSRTAFAELVASLAPLRPILRRPTPVAVSLVLGEALVVPLVLLIPAAGFMVAIVVLVGLTAGVLLVVRRRLVVRCRCFGASNTPLGARHLVRNGVLSAAGGLGLAAAAVDGAETTGVGVVLAAVVALIVASLVIRYDDIVDLFV